MKRKFYLTLLLAISLVSTVNADSYCVAESGSVTGWLQDGYEEGNYKAVSRLIDTKNTIIEVKKGMSKYFGEVSWLLYADGIDQVRTCLVDSWCENADGNDVFKIFNGRFTFQVFKRHLTENIPEYMDGIRAGYVVMVGTCYTDSTKKVRFD